MTALLMPSLMFIVGLVLIVKGGDYFVTAASWMSEKTGIPKMIVGATVVSFATTLPELIVSVTATYKGLNGIAIGNAIGSVTCNTGLILGVSFLLLPVQVKLSTFLDKGILMIVSTLCLMFFSLDGKLVTTETYVLFGLLALFFYFNVSGAISSGKENKEGGTRVKTATSSSEVLLNLAMFVGGSVGIIIGAQLLVDNGETIARFFNVPDSVIGLTIVALGTSLPELVTTLTAIAKKESSLSVGNIIGANTIDMTLILSTCSLVSADGLTIEPATYMLDIPVSLSLMCIAIIPTIFTKKFSRWQGVLMLLVFGAYIWYVTMG